MALQQESPIIIPLIPNKLTLFSWLRDASTRCIMQATRVIPAAVVFYSFFVA